MAHQKQICLTDETGQIRWFQQEDLEAQLAGADMSASGALKGLVRNLANAVRDMRSAQTDYFKAQYGTSEKERLLKRSKDLESKVDGMVKATFTTLQILS